MIRAVARASAVATLGALAGAICLVAAYASRPAFTLEMDRDLPRTVSGIYPPERERDITFAWTAGSAEVMLPGLDRRIPWVCVVRYRGARAEPLPQPVVDVAVDGITSSSRTATNAYEDVEVRAPSRDRPGLALSITVAPTVVPGPQDRRQLGAQLDRVTCRPDEGALALPPRRALTTAMLASAAFGGALALLGITVGTAIGATLLVAGAQAVPFSIGAAPFGTYGDVAVRLAFSIAAAMLLVVAALERVTGERLRQTARFVVAFSAAVLYLKLLGLLHPSKALIDAVFQAHRLEWVLSGRYFFTQPMPGGVQFPYAIGLYVFAAPWSWLTRDYVTLLRVVVCAAEVVAGALLYVMIVRTRGDRLAGAVAVALFSVVPLAFWFVGNANLTNAFGQSVALATVAVVTVLPLRPGQVLHVLLVIGIASLAFLSHISTMAILLVTLAAIVVLYRLLGGPALRAPAARVLAAASIAFVISVVAYYGHFGEVYQRALRVRADTSAAAAPAARTTAVPSLPVRTVQALKLTTQAIGWPILVLAAVGAWRFRAVGTRDRLALAVLAWAVAYVVFLGVGLMRVDPQYQRYSYEFVGRVAFATYPAAVILAAHGAVWAWRAGIAPRLASAALTLTAIAGAVRQWADWLQ